MQNASRQNQFLLRRNIEADTPLSRNEMMTIWNMMCARPEHVNEDEWIAGKRLREQSDKDFLIYVAASRGGQRGTPHEYFHVLHGAYLLLKPIGGIFDMSHLKTRLATCIWLVDRVASAEGTDRQNNTAIFNHHISHFHDGPDRTIAFDLLYQTLKGYNFVLPRHVISFEFLGDEAERRHLGVFVRVQERSNPQADHNAGKSEGKLNALCGLIVNPKDDPFATPDRPTGMNLESGGEEMRAV